MFGYAASEIIGESVSLLIPSPHRVTPKLHQRYLQTGTPHVIGMAAREMMAQHKSGRLIPVELSVTEINNNGERVFTGMLRDISAHKQAEAALIAARGELQGRSSMPPVRLQLSPPILKGLLPSSTRGLSGCWVTALARLSGSGRHFCSTTWMKLSRAVLKSPRSPGRLVTGFAVFAQQRCVLNQRVELCAQGRIKAHSPTNCHPHTRG